jgi:phage terminase large subunit GpA-like protein
MGMRAPAAALVFGALAAGLMPDPPITVSAWAQQSRFVSSEASARPGKWDNAVTPYLVEPMDCMSLSDPCREVAIVKAAQLGFTEAIINAVGTIATRTPCPAMIVQPTTAAMHDFVRLKLEPAIAATPELRKRVQEQKSRDESGSTTRNKRFAGGFLVLALATSSADLQSKSIRFLALDEVTEYPAETGERGDPVDQALARTLAYSENRKVVYNATPGDKGSCRISAKYAESDQREFYVPCPQCDAFQPLHWQAFVKDRRPTFFVCQANGCPIEHHFKDRMIRAGVWIKTYDGGDDNPAPAAILTRDELAAARARTSGGRSPGFFIWQAYSPFVPWDDIADTFDKAKVDPRKLKTFTQQYLGQAWEDTVDAPPAEKLFEARGGFQRARVPTGALFLTGFADVQKDRLEWGVYAWGQRLTAEDMPEAWLIDFGVIAGDPEGADVWRTLDGVVDTTYSDAFGKAWDIDAFGVDAGYLSNRVYAYAMKRALPRQAHEPHNPTTTRRVYAVDGRAGWKNPPLWLAKSSVAVDFGGRKSGAVQLWASGTFDLKSDHYHALRQLLAGPDEVSGRSRAGTLHLGQFVDRDYLEQATAEQLVDTESNPPRRVWVCPKGKRNEALDIAVGSRALAYHLSSTMTPDKWAALAARRYGPAEAAQGDLAAVWNADLANAVRVPATTTEAAKVATADEAAKPRESWVGSRGRDWFRKG